MKLIMLECEMHHTEYDEDVRIYKSFKKKLSDKRFDVISIDGPYGGDMTMQSRVDILSILPECLAESWILFVDDLNRTGEKNTFEQIKKLFDEMGIKYESAVHNGSNSFGIITSIDNRYYCRV